MIKCILSINFLSLCVFIFTGKSNLQRKRDRENNFLSDASLPKVAAMAGAAGTGTCACMRSLRVQGEDVSH